MRLSKNFELYEFLRTDLDPERDIFPQQYSPDIVVISNLQTLCRQILQPLRDYLKLEVSITSGYRCLELNQAVGGSSTLDHMKGCAADFVIGKGTSRKDMKRAFEFLKTMNFKQLIDEKKLRWIHVSYVAGSNRKEILYL